MSDDKNTPAGNDKPKPTEQPKIDKAVIDKAIATKDNQVNSREIINK